MAVCHGMVNRFAYKSLPTLVVSGMGNPIGSLNSEEVLFDYISSHLHRKVLPGANAGYPGLRVAWCTASDAHIHLGLFGGGPVLQGTVTTAQTTLYGPALTVAGRGGPFMSWTDAAQTVNVSPVNI